MATVSGALIINEEILHASMVPLKAPPDFWAISVPCVTKHVQHRYCACRSGLGVIFFGGGGNGFYLCSSVVVCVHSACPIGFYEWVELTCSLLSVHAVTVLN